MPKQLLPDGFRWTRGSAGELLAGHDNSMGFLRIAMAVAVIVSHSRILGFGRREPVVSFSHGQITLGQIAVYGFFVLSGLLVTRSGARLPVGRFLLHRALRLLPGLWVCLLVTAAVAAPIVRLALHGGVASPPGAAGGPFSYLTANWTVALNQQDVSGLMGEAVRRGLAHNRSFDGALWSLRYEILCYAAVAATALVGILPRARRAVLLLTAVAGWYVVGDALRHRYGNGPYGASFGHFVTLPQIGSVDLRWFCYLGFAFGLGACAEVYRERVPVSDPLGAAALLAVVASLRCGYFFAVGVPALAYALVWLAVRLPAPLRRVGARNDYSYGVYIYGFVVEQVLVVLGAARWGYLPYLALSLAGTAVMAALSWHLVERPALRLKGLGAPRTHVSPPRRPEGAGTGTGTECGRAAVRS